MGLIGENGAGKSTLMKILGGVITDYQGNIKLYGSNVQFSSPKDAEQYGIAFIHQELSLVPCLSVADNIFLGKEPHNRLGIIDKKQLREQAEIAIQKLGLHINVNQLVSELPVGMQQMVEIAKAILMDAKIIIMDEPTSALSPREIKKLFDIIRKLQKKNTTFIYISHKLDEVTAICSNIIAMRDGKVIHKFSTSSADTNLLVKAMLGRNILEFFPVRNSSIGDTSLKVENFSIRYPDNKDRYIIKNINLEVREGEILGIFGLMGAGQKELAEGLFGLYADTTSGNIFIKNKNIRQLSPATAIANGIALVPEDRKSQGIIPDMPVSSNITLATIKKQSRKFIIDKTKETNIAKEYITKLNIATSSPYKHVVELSGGNQQKVVIGKYLLTHPRVLILDEPARGVDIGAKTEIYKLINNLTKNGMSVILVSSDPDEIFGMSDRIMVMRRGKLSKAYNKNDKEKILAIATGLHNDK